MSRLQDFREQRREERQVHRLLSRDGFDLV